LLFKTPDGAILGELEASEETLEQQIDRIALAHEISTTTLYNLAWSESKLGTQRVGDDGKSCGVIHFHKDYYPEENSRCNDDEYILNRAAEMLANGEGWKSHPVLAYHLQGLWEWKSEEMLRISSQLTPLSLVKAEL